MAVKRGRLRIFFIASAAVICLALVAVAFLVKYANVIAKSGIEQALGKDFSVGRIELKWGSVRVEGVVMKNKAGKEVLKVESLVVRADFMGLIRKKYIISSVLVEKPYIHVEVDNRGRLVSPVFPAGEKTPQGTGKAEDAGSRPDAARPPVTLRKIVVVDGSVDYLDRKPAKGPVMTRMRHLDMEIRDLTVPFTDDLTKYTLKAVVPEGRGSGSVKSEGKIRLRSKNVECSAIVRDLDITHFKPYYHGTRSVNVTRGLLDLDIKAKIASNRIHAPGRAVLKNLEFESGPGLGNRFMGVPVALVVAFLKKGGDRIPVDFVISGDLDNPRFNVTENFVNSLSFAIAGKLGLSVKDMGESVFGLGAEGAKKVGEGITGIGEGIKNIFKK